MPNQPPVPLSAETELQIAEYFKPEDHNEVGALLLQYGTARSHREVERVRFDILHVAADDIERVRRLVALASRDYRDVLSAEYTRIDGKSVPHEWAMRHEVNRKLRRRD